MITLTYEYKLTPAPEQRKTFDNWLEACRSVWNLALRERQDWVNSRKCEFDACSILSEYIMPADAKRPTYASQCKGLTAAKKEYAHLKTVRSQVLQLVLKQLETAFVSMWERGLVERPRFFLDASRLQKLLRIRLKHQKKGSKNWRQLNPKIARIHEHIFNFRKNWHFKLSHHLCDQAGMIFAGNLNLKAMSKGMPCKHTLDAGLGQFLNILSGVCWKRSVYIASVDCRGTSQTCPRGAPHTPKDLSVRVHQCAGGGRTNRDIAAAKFGKKQALLNLNAEGQAVFKNVCGDGLTGIEISSQESLKQKTQAVKFGIPHCTRSGQWWEDVNEMQTLY